MPDGDIVHMSLAGIYQKPYQVLCEGKLALDECARITMEALKKDIQTKGSELIVLLQSMAKFLKQAIETGVFDRVTLSKDFDRFLRQSNAASQPKELCRRAVKGILHAISYGQSINTDSLSEVMIKGYMQEVYKSEFLGRIPLTDRHHAGVESILLEDRIKEIKPDIDSTIEKWGKKANEDGHVEKLRLPRRSRVPEVDLEEDLL